MNMSCTYNPSLYSTFLIHACNAIQAFRVSVHLQAFLVAQLLESSSALLWELPCSQQWPSCLPGTQTLADAGVEGLWFRHVTSSVSLADMAHFAGEKKYIFWKARGGERIVKRDEAITRICAAQI